MKIMIPLVKDTIDQDDINKLIEWLKTYPRLTKGEFNNRLEACWSEWLGCKHSVYVNSGSSANLAMAYALLMSKRLRNLTVVAPAVSWVTTVSPFMQLGYKVVLCDADKETLGLDINHLKKLVAEYKPSVLILVHVLGVPCKMDEIREICEANEIILLEDSCESVGSEYDGIKTGGFGLMSSFSFYFGHHLSTIEGGMVSTDDEELSNLLKSIRAHGWSRDLDEPYKEKLQSKYGVDEFKALYSFYHPGFNIRATDLQAFIGLGQMGKIDEIVKRRQENFVLYNENIRNDYWKIKPTANSFVSNFAYPIVTPKIKDVVASLRENKIETRPLICGSIGKQPFWIEEYGECTLEFADVVDDYGLYLPNNHQLTNNEIRFVCEVVNKALS
jgi:CDP-6-deoxy-D-xylo-4-hexulose-3-dehydrase